MIGFIFEFYEALFEIIFLVIKLNIRFEMDLTEFILLYYFSEFKFI
jgi:hypothetical protein